MATRFLKFDSMISELIQGFSKLPFYSVNLKLIQNRNYIKYIVLQITGYLFSFKMFGMYALSIGTLTFLYKSKSQRFYQELSN